MGLEIPEPVPGGHTFVLDDDGEIDQWRVGRGYHNGPECSACGGMWCRWCSPGIWAEQCPAIPSVVQPVPPDRVVGEAT